MTLKAYSERILKDKTKLFFIMLLLLLPILDIVQILYDLSIYEEALAPDPRFATFNALYTVGSNHLLHKLMFWFLPLYLLIICGEDSLEDQDAGYSNVLKSRLGKRTYIISKAKNSFIFSSAIVCISLLANFILLLLIFDKGGHVKLDISNSSPNELNDLYVIGYNYPIIANLVNILMCTILSGLIGTIGNLLALCLHDRKLVYGICFLIWFIFIQIDGGLMTILHPFAPVNVYELLVKFLSLCLGYGIISIVTIITEVKSDEI